MPDAGSKCFKPFYDQDVLAAQLERAKGLPIDSRHTIEKALRQAQALGPNREIAQAPDAHVLAELDRDFPNFAAVTQFLMERLHLSRVSPDHALRLPPLLLNGSPGVGKTAYCRRLACLLGLRFENQDVSQDNANFSMLGLDVGYSSGKPGRIWQSLMDPSMSVMWLLDELDKAGEYHRYGGVDYLLSLLEPLTAASFSDAATQLPVNAAWIFWMATSNSLQGISAPLLSRFEVFEISQPTHAQMHAIVRSVQRDLYAHEDWAKAFPAELAPELIHALSVCSPREMRRALVSAYARAAASGRRTLSLDDIDAAKAHHLQTRRIGFV